jgi:NAD(P)-dependent dehydrogenase (short-subunit alcohol dehydrogenase family)
MLMKLLAPGMQERRSGVIVNVTSGSAQLRDPADPGPWGVQIGYGTYKAALNRLTNSIATLLYSDRVAVIAVDPGNTMTELMEIAVRARGMQSTAHAMSVPAKTVAYLCSCADPMAYTGQVIVAADFAREHGLA